MIRNLAICCLCLLGALAGLTPASAQTSPPVREARLLITVVDATGGVLPGALVTVTGLDNATKAAKLEPVKTTDKGLATIEKLALGRYAVQAEFPGFQPGLLKEITIRAGENKHGIILALKNLEDSVTVTRDPREAASDRAGLFAQALTREQIAALSDDPEEMRRQLLEIAGPDAVFKVDSFEGAQLPPKGQIRAIRMARDQFAAENHYAGGHFIEIITQPGTGPLRGNTNFNFTNSAMESRNPFADTKGPSANRGGGFGLSGTLIENKMSFSVNFNGSNSYSTPLLRAALPGGTRSETLNLRQPSQSGFVFGQWDYALTKDHTLRGHFTVERFSSRNAGVGAYDLPERAYRSSTRGWYLNLSQTGPIGRRTYLYSRFSLSRNDTTYESEIEAPTIRVLDAFTSGGAQRDGGRRNWNINLGADVDYIRGIHSWRVGIALDGLVYRSNERQDYLGTYTFSSLADFEAGRPRSYTRRVGDPLIRYNNLYAGVYIQDDIRVSRSLTLSPGVRYEAQTHLNDYNNFAPRFGFTWSPFKSGRTSIRASAGIFYDWLSTSIYEQTLRIDGFRQQELNVIDPSFPDPGLAGTTPPINRYLLDPDMKMLQTLRLSVGVQQSLTTRFRVGVSYSDTRNINLTRGQNLNAPQAGVRTNPDFANVIEAVSDAESRMKSVSTNFSLSLSTPGPATNQAFFNWRRGSVSGSYTFGTFRNNTDGTFSVPATGSLDAEWGPANGEVRHRFAASWSTQAIRNLNAGFNFQVTSAPPYTIRTGTDDNGDLIFNDRPEGVGRNTARAAGRWDLGAVFGYFIGFGSRRVTLPPGVGITSVGGVMTVTTTQPQPAPRYRLSFNVRVTNLTNRHNLTGFSGVMTSPFFGKPQSATGVRKVHVSMGLSF